MYITLKFKITYKLGRMIAFQQNHMKVCFNYYFYLLNALVAWQWVRQQSQLNVKADLLKILPLRLKSMVRSQLRIGMRTWSNMGTSRAQESGSRQISTLRSSTYFLDTSSWLALNLGGTLTCGHKTSSKTWKCTCSILCNPDFNILGGVCLNHILWIKFLQKSWKLTLCR